MTQITTEKLVNSRFVYKFQKMENFCLMHSLTMKKIYGGRILDAIYTSFKNWKTAQGAIAEISKDYPPKIIKRIILDMIKSGMLVKSNESDLNEYILLFNKGLNLNRITHMYFIPTTECNYRCKYCFVKDEKTDFPAINMSKNTSKKSLEVFAKLCETASNPSITFYGGEPLLNKNVLLYSMRYARRLEQKGIFKNPVRLSMVTNGSQIDGQTIETLMETKVSVSVSIDGPRDIHDSNRVDIEGKPTFNRAINGYKKLAKAGLSPGISCTLTPDNINRIDEITDFIINELKPSGMGFNILIPKIGGGNPESYHEIATKSLVAAFVKLRRKGIYEDRVMRRVKPFIENHFHLKDCMGVGGQIVISPDGHIGPCQAFLGLPEYFPISVEELHKNLKKISSETVYQNSLFNEWRHRFPLNMKECFDCFAISVCGGGCPFASVATCGSIWKMDERICHQSKEILKWMIWDTFNNYPNVNQIPE